MDQQQYGAVMEKLGQLTATQEAHGIRLEAQKEALDELDRKFDKHMQNDHAHPPFANGRSRRAVVMDVGRWGGAGAVAYAVLEALQRLVLG